MAEILRRRAGQPEMHAVDEHVRRDQREMRCRRFPCGGVVADADAHGARGLAERPSERSDEQIFGQRGRDQLAHNFLTRLRVAPGSGVP